MMNAMSVPEPVAVVMGGISGEREISLATGEACLAALKAQNIEAYAVEGDSTLSSTLADMCPAIVFNALHGRWGEDGCVQGLFEMMEIAYTHSGVRASALAMHKPSARKLFAAAGLPHPQGRVVSRMEAAKEHLLSPPYVVKPVGEGSSLGVYIVPEGTNMPPQEIAADDWRWGEEVLVEEYIAGRELSSALLDEDFLGVCEIIPVEGFYDYATKYDAEAARHLIPAPIEAALYSEIEAMHRAAHAALGCRSVTRADFRYDAEKKQLALLELNTQPGMTNTSLVPELASHQGISFDALVLRIACDASCRR